MKHSSLTTPPYWQQACDTLSKQDPIMGEIIARYPNEKLTSRNDAFYSLARSIIGQQISVKAADSVWAKFEALIGEIAPDALTDHTADSLRTAGLSKQKATYLLSLSEHFVNGSIQPDLFESESDEMVIKTLCQVKGIGSWTAEMFLMFHLLRPDIFPVKDIGIQNAIKLHYHSEDYEHVAKQWQPWRTVACWYLWRSLDPVPVEY